MDCFVRFTLYCLFHTATIVILLLSQSAAAQLVRPVDSLRIALRQAPNDTARIAVLCRLSEALVISEDKDTLARIEAAKAVRLAEQLSEGKYAAFAPYYRSLTLQTLGVTYRFATGEIPWMVDSYFQAALKEALNIPNEQLALQVQASIHHAWFTGLHFRIQLHRKDDKSVAELRREAESQLQAQQVIADKINSNALRGRIALNRAIVLADSLAAKVLLCVEAVRLYEQSPDMSGLAQTLQYLGFFADEIGDYPRAIQAFKRSARLHDSAQIEPRGLAICYQSLGDIYKKLADTAKALENYHRAEPYSERYDVRFNRIELLSNIAQLYHVRGALGKARTYFDRVILISQERNQGYDLLRTAQIYRLKGNFDAALGVLAVALRELEKLTPQLWSFDVLQELVHTYKEQALHYKNTQPALYRTALDSALLFAQKCLPLLLDDRYKIGAAGRFVQAYTLLYEISKEAGDSQSALDYHEKREYWKEKSLSSETYRAIAAMESRAVVEAAEAKVETLEAKERLQRTFTFAIGFAALAFVSIAGLFAWRYRERRQYSELLQKQNERLQELNSEKNEMIGMVSHDLKNPISAVRGFADLIQSGFAEGEQVEEISGQIVNTADRMLELVKNLLDVNCLEQGGMEFTIVSVDIAPMVESTVLQYRSAAEVKGIALHYSSEVNSTIVLADEQSLMQVLDNIISNAVKYSPHHKNIYIRLKSSSDAVRVEVADEGPGISEDDMKKLFGKFTRLSARPTGGEHSTGLGLSIVKKMVEAMNGRVWCESELGKGATFIVELPASSS